MWCRRPDSNWRPTDYKSVALPTVLLRLYGGAREDRTPDLLRARQALSQLSYGPKGGADTQNRTEIIGLETQGNGLYTIPAVISALFLSF